VKFLLDTHLLLWAANEPNRLSKAARSVIATPTHQLHFSAASIWEVALKSGLGRKDFSTDARMLRRGLLDNGYRELAINSEHAVTVDALPPIHKDSFDRILVAQSIVEGMTLLTSDPVLAKYPGPVRHI
jgi:PIN domain nuclease of toxin-antitoxin system